MITELRYRLLALQRRSGLEGLPASLPLGIPAIDEVLRGGFLRGALHEIAAPAEPQIAAVAGFALGLVSSLSWPQTRLSMPSTSLAGRNPENVNVGHRAGHDGGRTIFWIAEDMALAESGVPHGAGLDVFGLAPERLVMVSVAHRRDLLWAMEETLRSRAVSVVIGEMRAGRIDGVALRRLSLAAADSGALAFLLRATPANDASTAATRWIVGASPSVTAHGPRAPRFAAYLARNRYGPLGSWIIEWSDSDERFILATDAQPLATPAFNRSHRQVA